MGRRWGSVVGPLPHGLSAGVTDTPGFPGAVPVSALNVPEDPSVLSTLVTLVPTRSPYFLDAQDKAP